ncbi:MAG: hypothetical protein CMK83_23610 [Pseudomonadales bacterium]|jgi:opacity protein-like surface antigen|uniref:porin family protein n=1 Tax=unclassified Ketobacter TaxID=2639109 RepID=UPI000C65251F|nr:MULTISPECIES: porin family protein [unclassified Ketobacter]MAA60326.1 hypothetical protein [Pseudomonadales bacterium]MEC8813602.1 porin family protein [Pseudomonadota bacterium]TNC87675.1 MAG: hypothetical protein CSH49_14705 [Alcanivorax sp.]HAG94048.1 hypothetical protein [Gammaproteobacteria bacterium]MAQ27209.1 hypothetical protein [Pseudomonadales bacterium]|tara:strand:- start:374 stop:889 length:516 start_codon:yes stop_codon:yes gene_type:complete
MKRTLIAVAVATGMFSGAQAAMAEGESYVGAQYNLYTFSTSGLDDLEPDGLAFIIGGNLNENFQIEGRFGRSLSDDNVTGAALKVDEHIGFYVKGGMTFADMLFPYVILGYTKVDYEFWGASIDQTESDLSYGLGADVELGSFKVGLEWMMLQDKSDYELEGLSLNGAWRF